MADEQKVRDAVPPRWYTQEEIAQVLRSMNYGEPIIAELAPWFFRHLQSAFNKGFQKAQDKQAALSHASATAEECSVVDHVAEGGKLVDVRDALRWRVLCEIIDSDGTVYTHLISVINDAFNLGSGAMERHIDQAIAAKRGDGNG